MPIEKDLNYWKKNAEEDYMNVPISVLRYITELEKSTPTKIKPMAKIQIASINVLNLEYKGKRTSTLEKGYHYIAVVIEGFAEDRSEVRLEFQNGSQPTMIYDSFVSFAQDWEIISEFKFKDCFLPVKTID